MDNKITLTQAARYYWFEQFTVMEDKLAVLLADPAPIRADVVHDLRVAARRCQSVAQVCKAYLPAQWTKKILNLSKLLRRSCDNVRDLDVLLEWLLALSSPQLRTAGLLEALRREHDKARQDMIKSLSRQKIQQKISQYRTFLTQDDPLIGQQPYRLADVAASVLLTGAAKITLYHQQLQIDHLSRSNEADLHRLRIAGKNFRYSLELCKPVLNENIKSLRDQFCQFQDSLGSLHDSMRFAHRFANLRYADNLPGQLLRDIDQALISREHDLWREFILQWQVMTPQYFAAAVLGSLTDQGGQSS